MTLIDDVKTWMESAKWPPNKKLYRRALVGLGHTDEWGVGTMTWQEAQALFNTGKKKNYQVIADGLKEIQEGKEELITAKIQTSSVKSAPSTIITAPAPTPSFKMSDVLFENKTLRRGMQDAQRENKKLIEAIAQNKPDDCKEQLAAFEVADKYMRDALISKDEQIANMKKRMESAEQIMNPILNQKIVELEKDIENLIRQRQGHQSTVDELHRRLDAAQSRLDKLQNLEIDADNYKIKISNEVTARLEAEYKEQFLEMEKTILDQWKQLEKANVEDVTFNEAMGALTMGRVLPPGKSDTLPLKPSEEEHLQRFITSVQYVQGEAQDIDHLVGSRKQPGPLLKIHNTAIDDYGHVKTTDDKLYWHLTNMTHLDNLISHAVQELQAAKLLAEQIKG